MIDKNPVNVPSRFLEELDGVVFVLIDASRNEGDFFLSHSFDDCSRVLRTLLYNNR